MSPCKDCILMASCSVDCDEFTKYMNKMSQISTHLGILFSCGIVCLVLFSGHYLLPDNLRILTMPVFWIISTIISFVILKKFEIAFSIIVMPAAPFIAFSLLFTLVFKWFIRKRIRR